MFAVRRAALVMVASHGYNLIDRYDRILEVTYHGAWNASPEALRVPVETEMLPGRISGRNAKATCKQSLVVSRPVPPYPHHYCSAGFCAFLPHATTRFGAFMSDFIDYVEKHPAFFGFLASIAGGAATIIAAIVGWMSIRKNQKSEEKATALNEEKAIVQLVDKPYKKPENDDAKAQNDEEKIWRTNHPAAHSCANWYSEMLNTYYGDVHVKFAKTVITLYVGGFVRVAVWPRKNGRAVLCITRKDGDKLDGAVAYLSKEGIEFTSEEKTNNLRFDVNLQQLKDHEAAHKWISQHLLPQNPVNGQDIDPPGELEEEDGALERPSEKSSGVLAEMSKVLVEDGRWESEIRSNGIRLMPKPWLKWLPSFGATGDPRWWIYVWVGSRHGRLNSGVDMAPLTDLAKRKAILTELYKVIENEGREIGFKLPKSHIKEVKNNFCRVTAYERVFEWVEDSEPEPNEIRAAVKKALDDLYPRLEKLGSVLKPLAS
jgi:hypothetical protein